MFSFLFLSLARAGVWLLFNGLLHRQWTLYSVVSLFHSRRKWNFDTLLLVDTTQVLLSFWEKFQYSSLPTLLCMYFQLSIYSAYWFFFTQWLYPGVLNILINKFKRCMDQNSHFIQTQQQKKKKKKRNLLKTKGSTPENKGIGA